MLMKNTCPSGGAVDCGGLMVPPGLIADLDPTSLVVAEHVTAGRLTPLGGAAEASPAPPAPARRIPRQRTSSKES